MIKFVMCITRHPDMTREQFQDYWSNKHGPYFMKNAGDMRAKKYVQSLPIKRRAKDLERHVARIRWRRRSVV